MNIRKSWSFDINNKLNDTTIKNYSLDKSNVIKFSQYINYFSKVSINSVNNGNNLELTRLFKLNKTKDIIEFLNSDLNYDINYKEDINGDDYLKLSIIHNSYTIFKQLLLKKIDLFSSNIKGQTCLMYTMYFNNLKMFEKIIKNCESKAKLFDMQDNNGNTVFHYICYYNRIEFLIHLLKHNFNPNLLNKFNKTAIDYIADISIKYLITTSNLNHKLNNYMGPTISNKHILNNPKIKYLNRLNITSNNEKLFEINYDYIRNYLFIDEFNINYLKIIRKLGEGSFGKVFLIKNINTNKKYAMKVYSKDLIKKKNIIKPIIIEKTIMSSLNSSFLIKCFYNFESKDKLFLLLEYGKYGDLSIILKVFKKINESKIFIILAELVLALEKLHNHNILHRDIKPHNIVISEDGHCLLTDFGLAKYKNTKSKLSEFVGSYAYMSPEMILKKSYDRTFDYYMLGVTIIELLNGKNPFISSDLDQLKYKILYKIPKIKPKVNKNLKDLITKLLIKDKKRRIGYQHGIKEIKEHPCFKNIDWKKVENKEYQIFSKQELLKIQQILKIVRKNNDNIFTISSEEIDVNNIEINCNQYYNIYK